MNILFFITRGDTLGGAQTHVLTLANKFSIHGHNVFVCVGGESSVFTDELRKYSINFCLIPELKNSYNVLRDVRVVLKIKSIFNTINPDIISAHSTKANVIARLINFNKKYILVSTIHGWSFSEGIPLFKRKLNFLIEKLTFRFSTSFILVSKYDYQLGNSAKVINSLSVVIYNGVKDSFKNTTIDTKNIKIIMVARFDKQKNQLKLIEACKNIDNIEVIFVGDGPLLEQTKNKIKKIDTRKFIFKGFLTDVNALLSDSTIFALISNWEGFPMSTLEAMSHGLPVLVSNVGGACECVLDEVNGYRVNKSASTIEIGNLIHKMLANKTQLLMMSANSRKIYLENFTDEIMYKNTFNHFTFLLSANG